MHTKQRARLCNWKTTARRLLATTELELVAESDEDANNARAQNVVISEVAEAVATETAIVVETLVETVQQTMEYDISIEAGSAKSFETEPEMVSAVAIAGATTTGVVNTQAPTTAPITRSPTLVTKEQSKETQESFTGESTEVPTKAPTTSPTKAPTKEPTKAPTRMPTDITFAPTNSPTPEPTVSWQSRSLFSIWISGYLRSVGGMFGFW
jgi:hypothetical protein